MKLTYFLRPKDNLNLLAAKGVSEVIIGTLDHSRLGEFNYTQAIEAAKLARSLGLKTVLLCDALVGQKEFNSFTRSLTEMRPFFDAARALDPGVMQFLFDKTDIALHFVADTGNHNLVGLKAWENYFGQRLERIVLSIELSKESLTHIIPKLETPCELLVLGRILLFHSPRALLSPLSGEASDQSWIDAIGASEESPHKGFPLIENKQGSFMFLAKDFCLAEQVKDLRDMNLDYIRLDPTGCEPEVALKVAGELLSDQSEMAKDSWPNLVIRGFYGVNKSDVLFKKLKNPSRDKTYALAEVLDARKGDPVTVRVLDGAKLELGMDVKMITPEGRVKEFTLKSLRDLEGRDISLASEESIVAFQSVSGACVKSLILAK